MIVEVHYNPAEAQCDGPQALLPETFNGLMAQLPTTAFTAAADGRSTSTTASGAASKASA